MFYVTQVFSGNGLVEIVTTKPGFLSAVLTFVQTTLNISANSIEIKGSPVQPICAVIRGLTTTADEAFLVFWQIVKFLGEQNWKLVGTPAGMYVFQDEVVAMPEDLRASNDYVEKCIDRINALEGEQE